MARGTRTSRDGWSCCGTRRPPPTTRTFSDAERPLTARGRRDAAAVGRWLVAQDVRPDLVLCSTSLRTRQTWASALEAAPQQLADVPVRLEAPVYQAWSDTLLDLVRGLADDVGTVVLVGHAPGVPDLAERLNRGTGDAPVGDFPTSALAVLHVTGSWSGLTPGTASLAAYAVPRG